jgi:hypothetical protein
MLDRVRELAYRELELAEDEEVLSDGVQEMARPLEIGRERRLSIPLRAITGEHEVEIATA